MKLHDMPSILDREVSSVTEDAFGHRHYAEMLQSLLESSNHQPPYSVGLLGHWGTGKSSIKELYKSKLDDESGRKEQTQIITFNAWRHGGEDIKRALLRHVFLELGGSEEELNKEFYSQVQQVVNQKTPWGEYLGRVAESWFVPVFLFMLPFGMLLWLVWWLIGQPSLMGGNAVIPITAVIAACAVVFRALFNFKMNPLSRYAPVTMIQTPSTSAEQYESLLIKQLSEFKKSKTGKKCQRLIVFVDDLDRLSADEMVAGLDTIRTFMEVPKNRLPEDLGIIFVISCDEGRVADALRGREANGKSDDLPAAVFNLADARRYLDRIFQFRLEIPPFPRRDMRDFIEQKLKAIDGFEGMLPKEVSVEQIVERMIHVGVQSPRNAIQIANAFIQSWWLAKKREFEGVTNNHSGALYEGAVTKHPLSLAALSTLKVDFPEFYDHLLTCPELLIGFRRVIFDRQPFSVETRRVQEVLRKFVTFPEEGGEENEGGSIVGPEYRVLRRFLASLQDHIWPKSLRPLLMLNEDRIGRKLGDRGPEVYDSMVSGDTQGVLEALGKDVGGKPLERHDAELLKGIVDELANESNERRNSAALVIATLIKRLPDDYNRPLICQLARRTSESQKLREQIGLERLVQILEGSDKNEQRVLIHELVTDTLRLDDKWDFKLKSGELPSLEQSIDMAKTIAPLAMRLQGDIRLYDSTKQQLLEWLKSRTVSVQKKSGVIPFAILEKWVESNEQEFLLALGQDYSLQFIQALEGGDSEEVNIQSALTRVEKVYQHLLERGGKHIKTVWEQLSSLASLKQQEAFEFSLSLLSRHKETTNSETFSLVVGSLCSRLDKEMKNDREWPLNREEGGRGVLGIIEGRTEQITEVASSQLVPLINSWSGMEDTGEYAKRAIEVLIEDARPKADEIINEWISQFNGATTQSIIEWLALRYDSILNKTQKNSVTAQLKTHTGSDDISEGHAARFNWFVTEMRSGCIQVVQFQAFLQWLFPQVEARHNKPDYLKRVFPSIVLLLEHGPIPQTQNMIKNLFAKAKGNIAIIGELHHHIMDYWPVRDDLNYSPDTIWNDSVQLVRQQMTHSNIPVILRSLLSLLEKELVQEDKLHELWVLACQVWPHEKEASFEILSRPLEPTVPPKNLATLISGLQGDSDKLEKLKKIWQSQATSMTAEEHLEVAVEILQIDAVSFGSDADIGMRSWLELLEANGLEQMYNGLIVRDSLNSVQLRRIWEQVEIDATNLSHQGLSIIVSRLISKEDEDLCKDIFENSEAFTSEFTSMDQKFDACRELLVVFGSVKSLSVKNSIIGLVKELDGQGAVNTFYAAEKENMREEELELIRKRFPSTKGLK